MLKTMMDSPHRQRWVRTLLIAVFFCSGASGLIYEVAWARRLTHILGSTTFAISTVLAAFMGGLALGSYLVGRYADRRTEKSLAAYGVFEIAIALLALILPVLLRAMAGVYLALAPSLEAWPQVFSLLQFLLVGAVIVLPTSLMGGTLPLLARWLVAREEEVVGRVGTLYAANTLGAAAGTAVATYWLLPGLGVRQTELLAVAANLMAGAVALALDRKLDTVTSGSQDTERAAPELAAEPLSRATGILLAGIALSGLAAMVDQVAWSRVLALVLGSSVYCFGMMLLVFLIGLSLGSSLFARFGRGRAVGVFAIAQIGNALASLAGIALVPHLPALFMRGYPAVKDAFFMQQVLHLLLTCALVLPAAVLFGMAFPAAIAASADFLRLGRGVGRVTAWNTGGTVAGAFLGGFVLIPQVGLRATLTCAAAALAAAGLAALTVLPAGAWRRSGLAVAAVGIPVALAVPAWPRPLLTIGVGYNASVYQSVEGMLAKARETQLLFYKDGVTTTLSVDREGDTRLYRSNGKTDASTAPGDMANQLLLGHLPMLLHPDPRDVFVLGLGTGVSAAAVARYPVRSIDIADIEAAARDATRQFAAENRNVLDDARVRFLAADGRNALLARHKSYDVIISDPSDLWVAGVGNLFTQEFYQLARSRLRPGGVIVQWFHTHSLLPEQLKLIVATFRSVFRHTSLWRPNSGDLILIGSADLVPWDYPRLARRIQTVPGVAEDLRGRGLWHPLSVFSALVLDTGDLDRMLEGVRDVHTDDRPVVEYLSPRTGYADTASVNDAGVQALQSHYLPELIGFDEARDLPAHTVYLLGFGHASLGRTDSAIRLMEEAVARDPKNPKYWIGLGNQYRIAKRQTRASNAYRKALANAPGDPEAAVNLAAMLTAEEDDAEAERILRACLAASPGETAALQTALGKLLLDTGRSREALALLERLPQEDPRNAEARLLLGRALLAAGRREEAGQHLREAAALAPGNAAIQRASGSALLELGDSGAAVSSLEKAVALEPNNAQTLSTLAEALERRGDREGARSARQR
ncbi:MAG TPA: fused MFS/spermidine synthase, partial [Thermoanaerobaculia bacterium]|nr:fused MFS/spermidine synthase [Thermoanaerobaculia bacterium]